MDANALFSRDEETVAEVLPHRPISSVRDVQALYGRLYALGRGLSGEYGPFLSPDAAADLLGMERLVVVRVELDGEKATLADDPVRVVPYDEALSRVTRDGLLPDVPRVAHSKFEAARGVDHSVTHLSGQTNDPGKHADHAVERFTRWPCEDAIHETATVHDDGWVIQALDALGNDEAAMDRVTDDVMAATQNGQYLHTIAVTMNEDTVATTSQFDPDAIWHLPGEIEVFQEAMVRRKTTKFRAKNEASDASGEGVCYVDDADGEVYGVVDDPLKWYLSKQMEKFPRFDPDQSWRTQGLGREAAIAAQNATTFLNACTESGPGVSAFYLPYFDGAPTVADARDLYATLARQADEDLEENVVATLYDQLRDADGGPPANLRFVLMVVEKYQKDRWRLLAFEPNGTTHEGVELAHTHHHVVNSPLFGDDGPLPRLDSSELLDASRDPHRWLNVVTGVWYFARTCAPPDDDDEPSSDDVRYRATARVVGGRPVDARNLLSAYVDHVTDRFDPDDDYPFPGAVVAEQHAQLTALANAGLLEADADTDYTVDIMTEETTDGTEMNRVERLEDFVERHDALSSGARRGVFALGALVGRISRHQRSKNRSMTAVKRHPVDKISVHNVSKIATDLVDANVVYSDEEGYTGTMYAELMDEVVDGLLDRSPTDWDLDTADLRYHYAMGIAYGLNDRSTSDYDNE